MSLHLTALDYAFWGIQFALEVFGFCLIFRRRLWSLSAYLMARVVFDIITFSALQLGHEAFYDNMFMHASPIKYAWQIVLGVTCCGEIVKEAKMVIRAWAAAIAGIGSILVFVISGMEPLRYQRFLDVEISVNGFLCILLMLAMVSGRLSKPWTLISAGIITLSFSASLLGILKPYMSWDIADRMYSLSGIVALGLWVSAGFQAWPVTVRQGLGVVIEPTEIVKTRIC